MYIASQRKQCPTLVLCLHETLFLIQKLVDQRVLETNMQSTIATCTVCHYRNCVKRLADSTINVLV